MCKNSTHAIDPYFGIMSKEHKWAVWIVERINLYIISKQTQITATIIGATVTQVING